MPSLPLPVHASGFISPILALFILVGPAALSFGGPLLGIGLLVAAVPVFKPVMIFNVLIR